VLGYFERKMRQGLTVLMYHRVLPDPMCVDYPLKQLAMPQSAFREQVKWLADHCRVLPVAEAVAQRTACSNSAPPVVSLTFDDGYSDSHDVVAPILEEAGVRGTFFVVADAVRSQRLLWFDRAALLWLSAPRAMLVTTVQDVLGRAQAKGIPMSTMGDWIRMMKDVDPESRSQILAQLREPPVPESWTARFRCMTVEEVTALHRQGHEIGSHTLTHPILPQLGDAELLRELRQSRDEAGTWLGATVYGLCYPNGDHDARVTEIARASGYRYACTVSAGANDATSDCMRLKRVDMRPDLLTTGGGLHNELRFRAEICLAYLPARRARDYLVSALRRLH
jgi:peptidoglycan/xylan/chitin deacetylase (PgdA/CDA1 family)